MQGGQTAIIPLLPPPATPVQITRPNNAANANGGAVFLGSGALGVVALGGGAYVLGSGGLGYSNRRSNPRASFRHPLLPPVRASADLIPAAVNTPQMQQFQGVQFSYPPGSPLPRDQNGYEYLPPDRVAFGDPLPPRPLKTTNSYATPSPVQQHAIDVQRLEDFDTQLYGISQQLY
ncbi:unnamed protein product [Acanthoscelides obtectus]|uniref:Uncharacterized protein n=1 Tax=Acanthoscelides obtectus TaxID=200917 RepID=A0A9P0K4S9_ACAOB|nr:unnamed protein product [Acanthoscelides obtectus]CAK1646182.1 hypothetical protein AOBTE_LOCUS14500 [Acanthoscelides obtectus]